MVVTIERIDDRDIAKDHASLKVFAQQIAALGSHRRCHHGSIPPGQLKPVLESPGCFEKMGSVPSFVEKEKRRNLLLTKQIAQRGEGGIRREEGYHD